MKTGTPTQFRRKDHRKYEVSTGFARGRRKKEG